MTKRIVSFSTLLRAVIIMCLICSSTLSKGQLLPSYSFSQQTGTFSAITGGSVAASGTGLTDQRYSVSLPFTFNFDNVNYTSINLAVNGFMSLGTTDPGSSYWMLQSTAAGFGVISGMDMNLASLNSTTELRYETQGIIPNRVFIAQWKHFGYPGGGNALSVTFQIRLSETSNKIAIVYDTCALTGASTLSVQVGLRGQNNGSYLTRTSSTSNWASTTAGSSNGATITYLGGNNPPYGLTYTFTPPPACTVPAQPTNLALSTPSLGNISIGYTPSSPGADKYMIVQTQGTSSLSATPVNNTYYTTGSTFGNGTVVYNGSATSYTASGLTQNTYYTYTVFPYNDQGCMGAPVYNTVNPLSGTIQSAGPKAYTWTPVSGSNDFTLAANWSPARTLPNSGDTLYFSNGGTVTATNVAAQTVRVLSVRNNTNVTLVNAGNGAFILNDSLGVYAGSSLTLASGMNLKFNSNSKPAYFYGNLLIKSNGVLDVTNALAHVFGTVTDSGTAASCIINSVANNLTFEAGSNYVHARDGGAIPYASYNATSSIVVTGMVNTSPTIHSQQTVGNFTWNCLSQAAIGTFNSNLANVMGNFLMQNSNTSLLRIGSYTSSSPVMTVYGDFTQSGGSFQISSAADILSTRGNVYLNGGTFDLNAGNYSNPNFQVYANLTQAAAHTITKTGFGTPVISFQGTTHQNINIGGTITNAPVNYVLNNLAGATLTGTLPVNPACVNTLTAGSWDGSGSFSYNATNSSLVYSSVSPVVAGNVEWPATNSPVNLKMSLTGAAPLNRINLPGDRTLTGTMEFNSGVIVLNDHNLTYTGSNLLMNTQGINSMIAADSTGYFIHFFPLVNYGTATYPIGNIKGTPGYTPAQLQMGSNTHARNIGVRVKPGHHPNDTSTNNYLNRYWTLIDDGGATQFTYKLTLGHSLNDIIGSSNYAVSRWDGVSWTALPGVETYGSPTSSYDAALLMDNFSSLPLNNTDFTGRAIVAHHTYTWTGATSKDFQDAANWTPNRNTIDIGDMLQFNDGNTDTVNNIPTQSISRLSFTNNTTVSFQAATGVANGYNSLTVYSDYDSSTAELQIDNGSALYLNGTYPLHLKFANTATLSKATIAGRLELVNTSQFGDINLTDFTYCTTTVTTDGVLAAGANNATPSITTGTPSTITVYGTYEHKFTYTGGTLPNCNWAVGSTVLVKWLTINNTTLNWAGALYNLVYDCPNQTGIITMSNLPTSQVGVVTVAGTFSVASTGTGELDFGGIYPYTLTVNNFTQTGGKIGLGFGGVAQAFNVSGTFNQSGGTMYSSINGTGVCPVIHFNGTSGAQNVSFKDAAPIGSVIYRVSNPVGINLAGTGTLTGNFNINANGGVRISTNAATPINTSLALVYNSSNTTLTYDAAGNCTASTLLYPSVNGPANLTVGMLNNSVLTVPFSRTIPGTLRMISGDIDMGANTLTLGTAIATPGTFTWTSGYIRLDGGTFTKWMGSTTVPTTAGTGLGFFPVGYNGANRNVSVYFNTNTALAAGGTLSVTHNPVTGTTTGLNVTDGAATITSRTNTSWVLTPGNGFSLLSTGTMGVKITAGDLLAVPAAANLHLMQAASVTGTHVTGSGAQPNFIAERTGLTNSTLANAFYIGSDATMSGVNIFISVANGDWNNGSTWNLGTVPTANDVVIIATNTNVAINGNDVARYATVQQGATLTANTGSLTLDSSLTNNGMINENGTAMTFGPSGGGRFAFINNGTLSVASGNIMLNGYLQNTVSSVFNQSGGNITIDGNAGGVVQNSVPASVPCLSFATPSLTLNGGTITFVDPHAVTGSYTLAAVSPNIIAASPAHTFIFGDGVSTAPNDFLFRSTDNSAGRFSFGNIIVNGTPSVVRNATSIDNLSVLGDITVNNVNGTLGMSANTTIDLKGNLTVNAGARIGAGITFSFTKNLPTAAYAPQTVSGAGTVLFGTNTFYNLTINNNAGGVVMNIGDVSVNTLTLTSGNMNIGPANTLTIGSAINNAGTNGWVIGKLQQQIISYVSSTFSKIFPVGDVNNYTPVQLYGTINSSPQPLSVIVSTVSGDHPAISSSPILPNKSVNRYFKVEAASNLTFAAASGNISMAWAPSDLDPGINTNNLASAFYNGTSWTGLPTATAASSAVASGLTNFLGAYQIGEPNPVPLITQQPVPQTICDGSIASYTVITGNVGVSYLWQVSNNGSWTNLSNGAPYSTVNTNSLSVVGSVPLSGKQYRCMIYSATDTAYSIPALLTVNPILVPVVNVGITPGNTICANTSVTFTATPVNGGTAPQYQWTKNGTAVGSNTTYTSAALANNDVIVCNMTSNATCPSAATVASTPITMTVNPNLTPTVSIAANPGNSICTGTSVTFTATPVNGGSTPHYQWRKNGLNVGSDSPVYTDASFGNGATISCIMTSSATCLTTSSATSNTIVMNVSSPVTPTISITSASGTAVCAGATATFTAAITNGGTAPAYQWKKNGVNVGTNINTYSDNTIASGDVISCSLTSSLACVTTANANSNNITMTVTPLVTPNVTISASPGDTICWATYVTYSAVITNQGNNTSYQWQINGSTASTFSSLGTSGLADGDVIRLIINTNPQCAATTIDTSNAITMRVNQYVTPAVSIAASTGSTVCAGSQVTFTATPVNGGTAPVYQWQKNGLNVGTNSATYTDNALTNGASITCTMFGNAPCALNTQTTSNAITMVVNPMVTPTVTISSNTGNTVCPGEAVTFTAIAANGGNIPSFQWKKNGSNVASGASYTTTAIAPADVITCELTSSNPCTITNTVLSNALTMTAATPSVPSVTITANPGTTLVSGQTVTFTAVPVNGGANPTYQWRKNGINLSGQTNTTYTTNTLISGDVISVKMHSSAFCSTPDTASSNQLTMMVTTSVGDVKNLFGKLQVFPNPSTGSVTVTGELIAVHGSTPVKITLLDMQGRSLLSDEAYPANGSFSKQVLLPESLASGMYMLRLTYEEESRTSLISLQR